jgi:hypothetical protein
MTPARATEIIRDAKARATYGPWSDQLSNVMTADERAEIITVWRTMPGYTCFVDALHRIERNDDATDHTGRVQRDSSGQTIHLDD